MPRLTVLVVVVTLGCLGALMVLSHAQQQSCGRPYPRLRPRPRPLPRPLDSSSRSGSEERRFLRSRRQAAAGGEEDFAQEVGPPAPYSSCGVVPINDRFLVTAAYCVIDPDNPISSVQLGDLDLSQEGEASSRPAEYDIELILIHPNFTLNPESGIRYNDIALLKTAQKIRFNEAVFPYCLSQRHPSPGTPVIISGFGYVNETHKSTHLQEAEINVMSSSSCEAIYRAKGKEALLRQAYPNLLNGADVVCAGHPESGACEGDEGGPLLREDSFGRLFLEGVISFTGDVCGPDILPTVSVSIADHYDYILDALKNN